MFKLWSFSIGWGSRFAARHHLQLIDPARSVHQQLVGDESLGYHSPVSLQKIAGMRAGRDELVAEAIRQITGADRP